MSRRRLALAVLLATLASAPPAAAKGIEQVKACGADGCRTSKSVGPSAHGLIPPVSVPEPAPFYRLEVGMGHDGEVFDTVGVLWAPSLGMIANDEPAPVWVFADAATQRVARRLSEGLEPFPAATMPVAAPQARVDETVTPESAAVVTPPDGGGPPWALLAALVAGAALLIRPARRRAASRAARSASRPPSPERG